nr:DUF6264 family protein [Gordonia bronchialis]
MTLARRAGHAQVNFPGRPNNPHRYRQYMTDQRPIRVADTTVSVLLLACHVAIAGGVLIVTFASAMGTDACAYENCGSPRWIDAAAWTGILGSLALLAASLFLVIRRVTHRHRAFPFALAGCVLELLLIPVVFALASQAGPIN